MVHFFPLRNKNLQCSITTICTFIRIYYRWVRQLPRRISGIENATVGAVLSILALKRFCFHFYSKPSCLPAVMIRGYLKRMWNTIPAVTHLLSMVNSQSWNFVWNLQQVILLFTRLYLFILRATSLFRIYKIFHLEILRAT